MKRKMILLVMLLLLGLSYSNAQYGPVVSLSFDDGGPSWYDLAFPVFQEHGVPGVCFINATNVWVAQQSNIDKLLEMQAAGWEIGNHTYHHSTGVTDSNVSAMTNWLNANGFLPNSGFQQPGGGSGPDYGHATVNIVKKYHPCYTNRGLPYGNSEPYDIYYLTRTPMENSRTDAEIIAALEGAVANNEWVIFYGHSVGNSSGFETSVDRLRLILDECNSRGIPIKTVREVITDLYPPGHVIECSEDTLQDPVLTYFEEDSVESFSTSVWNEYWHNTSWTGPRYIGSPVVYCHTSNDSLPVMKFYRNVSNGEYEVRAVIIPYDIGRTYKVYYSFDEGNPSQYNVEVDGKSDAILGTVTVTDGQFALYTQKADVVSGSDGYVGWAYVRLFAKPLLLNLRVFLEGPYNGSTMTTTLNTNNLIPLNSDEAYPTAFYSYTASTVDSIPNSDIVDWVLLELRTDSTTIVGTRAAFIKSGGTIVDTDGSSPVTFTGLNAGNYYVVVRHRNHLAIMSASAIPLNSSSALYDFSNSQSQAYTTGIDPMVALPGSVYGMIAADANKDGSINATDLNTYWIPQNGTPYDYQTKTADFNLDATINATDLNLYWIPRNGKATQVP